MSSRAAIDVSALPPSSVSTHALVWWGNVLMLTIEGTVLALLVASYFYLRFWLPAWPPPGADMPSLLWPTLNLVVLLASLVRVHRIPTAMPDRDARRRPVGSHQNVHPVRIGAKAMHR